MTARQPTEEFTEEFDVVIVGSGATGATYARLITEARPSATVLIVEAGPVLAGRPGVHTTCISDPQERRRAQIASQGPNQFPYELSAISGTAHNATKEDRHRALSTRAGLYRVGRPGGGLPTAQASCNAGGMTAHWFGACPRPGGPERIDAIASDTLDEALGVAERLLQVSHTQFTGSTFAAHVQRVLGEALDQGRPPNRRVQPMPMALTRTPGAIRRHGSDIVLAELLTGPNDHFELRTQTLCERILVTDGHAVGVSLHNRATGAVTTVGAGHVVVAGDPLRTPQLLFASGVRPAALGRYLNEHSQVSLLAEVDGLPDPYGPGGHEEQRATTEPPHVTANGVTWLPYQPEEFPFHGMLVQIDPATLPPAASDRPRSKPLICVHLFTAQDTRPDNRLEFSDTEQDWTGMPAMTIHHTLSERDHTILAFAEAEALRLGKILGGPAYGETPWTLPSGSSLHYQGTVRMGAVDDGTSVCDPTSRVWGLDNLYVAGNGVIPTRTACNPTLTSVALAVIGAREITRHLAPDPPADHRPDPPSAPGRDRLHLDPISAPSSLPTLEPDARRGQPGERRAALMQPPAAETASSSDTGAAALHTRLGRTALRVSRLALGTVNFGGRIEEDQAHRLMSHALAQGVNLLDTANIYGWRVHKGHTEETIGRWLAGSAERRERVVLATKVGDAMGEDPNAEGLSARNIIAACEASLRRLRTDWIDLYQFHHLDPWVCWDEVWQAMDLLVTQGKVRYVGSSNFSGWGIARAQEAAARRNLLGLVSEQCLYNLVTRHAELEVIPAARAYGLAVFVWSPLHGGLLGGVLRKTRENRAVKSAQGRAAEGIKDHHHTIAAYEKLCADYALDPAQAGMAWTLSRPGVTGVVIGPRTEAHIDGALEALRSPLPTPLLTSLDELFPQIGRGGPAPDAWLS